MLRQRFPKTSLYMLLFVPLLAFVSGVCPALADDFRVYNYGAEEGLDVEFTKGVNQDAYGFIWVATDRGLYRSDGVLFSALTEGLPSPYVKSIVRGADGSMYAITDLGVVKIIPDIKNPAVRLLIPGNPTYTDSTLLYPKHGIEDSKGNLWISDQCGVARYSNGEFKRYLFPEKDYAYDFLRSFRFLDAGVKGIFVLSINGSLYRYVNHRDQFQEMELKEPLGQISSVLKMRDGRFLIGGSKGLQEIILPDASGGLRVKMIVPDLDISSLAQGEGMDVYLGTWAHGLYHVDPSFPSMTLNKVEIFEFIKVNDLFYSDGNLWVSTDVGVSLLHETQFRSIKSSGLNTYIHDIEESPDGYIHFCDGARIMRINSPDGITRLDTVFMIETETILQMQFLRNSLYISTARGEILRVRNGRVRETFKLPVVGSPILTMIQDSDGNLWATQSYVPGLYRLDASHKITSYRAPEGLPAPIQAVGVTSYGVVAATVYADSLRLYRFDDHQECFTQALAWPIPSRGGRCAEVFDVSAGPDDGVLIATTDGLYRWDSIDISKIPLELKESDEVMAVATHPTGKVWVGTRFGVRQLSRGTQIQFSVADGLPARTISRHSIMVDHRGYVWIGTSLGAAWTRNTMSQRETSAPKLLGIYVDGNEVNILEDHDLTPATFMEMKFATLAFPGNEIVYQHRLLITGNEPWSRANSTRSIFLNRLSAGDYEFQVRARRLGSSTWSEPLSIPLHVQAEWYERWWAFLLFAILLLGAYILLVRLHTRSLLRENERLEHMVAQRTRQALDQLERSKNAEIEAQQMKITNRIAGTIAHEFNNPLAIIQASLDLIKEKELNPKERQAYDLTQKQVTRMSNLVRKLLKLQGLREMDYVAGMKIMNIHEEDGETGTTPSGDDSSTDDEKV